MIKFFLQYCFIIVVFSVSINRTKAQNASDSVVLDYKVNLELNVQNQIKKTAFYISTQQNYIAIDSNFIREISGTNFKPFDFQLISNDSIFAFIDINGIRTVRKEANNQQYVVQFIDGKQFYNDIFFQILAKTKANADDSLTFDILHTYDNQRYRVRLKKIKLTQNLQQVKYSGFWGLGFLQDDQLQQYKIISIEFAYGYLAGTQYDAVHQVIPLSAYVQYSDSMIKFKQLNQDSISIIYQEEIKKAETLSLETDMMIQKIKTTRTKLAENYTSKYKAILPEQMDVKDLKNHVQYSETDTIIFNIINYDYLIQRRTLEINIKNTPDSSAQKNLMYNQIICTENKRKVLSAFSEKWLEALQNLKKEKKARISALKELIQQLDKELNTNFSQCIAH